GYAGDVITTGSYDTSVSARAEIASGVLVTGTNYAIENTSEYTILPSTTTHNYYLYIGPNTSTDPEARRWDGDFYSGIVLSPTSVRYFFKQASSGTWISTTSPHGLFSPRVGMLNYTIRESSANTTFIIKQSAIFNG
ncbi:MAG: hypothetical protein PHU53_06350, partial [Thermoplasmata archaeon]|nr:hypothetical protein [Thermoplasmata archaeon]